MIVVFCGLLCISKFCGKVPNGDTDFQIANIRIFPVLHMGVKEKNDNHNREKRGSVAVLQLLQLFQSTAIFAPIWLQ